MYLSEDWALTERAREAGFHIYIDSTIKLKHAGRYEYDWNDFFQPVKQDKKTFIYSETSKAGQTVITEPKQILTA